MGNDGGSIPKRRELVKNAARAPTTSELKATVLESLGHAWTHCALSHTPLDKENVASDWRGHLYNYEAVLNGLMPQEEDSTDATAASLGIRSLRDVEKLKFSISNKQWVCPISMKELGPAVKSVYLVPCGHVFAEVAITEIQEKTCPTCTESFDRENVIPILPSKEQEVTRLQSRMDKLRGEGLTHTLKKDKAQKKKKRKADDTAAEIDSTARHDKTDEADLRKKKADPKLSGINNVMAASLTAKVMAEQEERNKRRKLAEAVRAR